MYLAWTQVLYSISIQHSLCLCESLMHGVTRNDDALPSLYWLQFIRWLCFGYSTKPARYHCWFLFSHVIYHRFTFFSSSANLCLPSTQSLFIGSEFRFFLAFFKPWKLALSHPFFSMRYASIFSCNLPVNPQIGIFILLASLSLISAVEVCSNSLSLILSPYLGGHTLTGL